MNTRFIQWSLTFFLFFGALLAHVERVEALSGSAVWNSDSSVSFLTLERAIYARKAGYDYPDFRAIAFDTTKVAAWAPAIKGIHASVRYTADVKQNGNPIRFPTALRRGVMTPIIFVGDTVSFTSLSPRSGSGEISWFGTGYSLDSPYGIWRAGATAPDTVDDDAWLRNETVIIDWNGPGGAARTITWKKYAPLSVNPPTITYDHTGSTAGLDCNATGDSCKVTSSGDIVAHVNYGSTYGKFYEKYLSTNAETELGFPGYNTQPNAYPKVPLREGWGNCVINAMRQSCDHVATEDFFLRIDAQSIEFNLKAIEEPPLGPIPTLSVAPAENPVDTDFFFTARGQASDPSAKIQYGFDLNNNGVEDIIIPNRATLPSGTPVIGPYQWPTPGTYTVRVLTIDDGGIRSPWSDPVSVVVAPAPTATFTINGSAGPTLEIAGGTNRHFEWSSANATECKAQSFDGWFGDKGISGNEDHIATQGTDHVLTCTGPGGSVTKHIDVTLRCTTTTGIWGGCDCDTELKSRTNILSNCDTHIEKTSCDADEKKACRNFNWIETNP